MAWLQDSTTPVTNTFTPSTVKVHLAEIGANRESETEPLRQSFDMVPGHTISKDPKAWVEGSSEDCYLFVKVTKSENLDTYIDYAINSQWSKLDDDGDENALTDVYYIEIDADDEKGDSNKFEILAGGTNTDMKDLPLTWGANQVLVRPTVTEQMMEALNNNNQPTLTFEAFAVQMQKTNVGDNQNFTPAEAWALANPTT